MILPIYIVLLAILFSNPVFAEPKSPELVVYTYDSLVAKGGLGPEIFPMFEKKCGCKLKVLASANAGQLVARLQLDAERGKPTAHVVLGVDQHAWDRVRAHTQEWGKWLPRGYGQIPEKLRVTEPASGFLPFEYGVFAFIVDTEALREKRLSIPKKLADLNHERWKRSVILQDPRSSSPGTSYLLYSHYLNKERTWEFWKDFKSQWLTLAPGWDEAYGMFLKKEAPLVWSYTTSEAYHREHGDKRGRYRAVELEDGHPVQIEGVALVRGANQSEAIRKRAKEFLEFMISKEVQEVLPQKNWMLPVRSDAKLPESFQKIPHPKKLLPLVYSAQEVESLLKKWHEAVSR